MATKKAAEPKAAPARRAYRVTKWAGYDNYECSKCSFAHLDKAVLEAHLKAVHNSTLADAPSAAPSQ